MKSDQSTNWTVAPETALDETVLRLALEAYLEYLVGEIYRDGGAHCGTFRIRLTDEATDETTVDGWFSAKAEVIELADDASPAPTGNFMDDYPGAVPMQVAVCGTANGLAVRFLRPDPITGEMRIGTPYLSYEQFFA